MTLFSPKPNNSEKKEDTALFEMQEIGRRIADARRAKGLTQPDLAEKMGISFQAVSNWERGESMPDIAKLPELAAILGMSIDALLGAAPVPVPEAEPEMSPASVPPLSTEETPAAAPDASALRQIVKLAEHMDAEDIADLVMQHINAGGAYALSELAELAEYMDSEDIADLLTQLADAGKLRADELAELAEFMDSEDVADVAHHLIDAGRLSADELAELAEELDEEDLVELAGALIGQRGGNVRDFSRFLDEDAMAELKDIARIARANGCASPQTELPYTIKDIRALAPFLSTQMLDTIVKETFAHGGTIKDIRALAPFLSKQTLDTLVQQTLDQGGTIKDIYALAPFLSKQTLDTLVQQTLDRGGTIKDIRALAPFLSQETLSRIVEQTFEQKI